MRRNVGRGGEEKKWTDCMAEDLQLFGITGDWSTAVLDPGAWYSTVREGGCSVGKRKGKCVRPQAKEERSRRGGQG